MATIGAINVAVRANTKDFNRKIKGIRGTVGKVGKAVAKAGFAAGAAAVGTLTAAFVRGEGLNRAMTQSLAIMGEVSDTMRNDMVQAALEVSRTTVFSAREATQAYFFPASAGMTAEQAVAAMPQVAAFAQAGMFDLATATDLATDAQAALGLTSEDPIENLEQLTRVTDALVGANTMANASVEQFSAALTQKAGTAAKTLGQSLEETVAVLSIMADKGKKGEEAGTLLAMAMNELSIKAKKNEDAWKAMGVEVFQEGKFVGVISAVQQLEQALKGKSTEKQVEALLSLGLGVKSLGSIQMLLGESGNMQERLNRLMTEFGGITQRVAKEQMTPMMEIVNMLTGAWDTFSEAVHRAIGPALVDGLKRIVEFFKEMPGLTEFGKAGFIALEVTIRAFAEGVMALLQGLQMVFTSFGVSLGGNMDTSTNALIGTVGAFADVMHQASIGFANFQLFFSKVMLGMSKLPGIASILGGDTSTYEKQVVEAGFRLAELSMEKLPSERIAKSIADKAFKAKEDLSAMDATIADTDMFGPAIDKFQMDEAKKAEEAKTKAAGDMWANMKTGFADVTNFFQKKADEVDPLFGGEGMDSLGGVLAKGSEMFGAAKDKVLGLFPAGVKDIAKLSTSLPNAMIMGSKDAVSFLNQQKNTPEMQLVDLNTKQLVEQEKQTGFMDGLFGAWKDLTKTESTI